MEPSPDVCVVDIGGTVRTWDIESQSHSPFSVTLINNLQYGDFAGDRFQSVEADARELPFADNAFDIAFSNSVIEHLGTWESQMAFAREARRVARKLWIQTPARCFPIEAHLLAPYIQYMPKGLNNPDITPDFGVLSGLFQCKSRGGARGVTKAELSSTLIQRTTSEAPLRGRNQSQHALLAYMCGTSLAARSRSVTWPLTSFPA
jgi:Methyltransferase domain